MEAVVQILEAEELIPVMYIPPEMRHTRLEVTLRPVREAVAEHHTAHTNQEIMQKFRKAAELGEAKAQLKKKLTEGIRFDFTAEKILNGTMTEDDWQNLYTLQKQAWPQAAAEKAGV
ncbi:MAG: hypothetical protein LBL56_06825 [Treponema sp.]|jgi:hypothetical protein|nr:hypothetical protein [Treponema sp.]